MSLLPHRGGPFVIKLVLVELICEDALLWCRFVLSCVVGLENLFTNGAHLRTVIGLLLLYYILIIYFSAYFIFR